MPIRATFTGDVTDLRRGTQQARDEFRRVGTEAQGAARQLKAVGSSFDGSKLEGSAQRVARGIERIGGASRLTDSELTKNSRIITEVLQKYERMGVEAPAHIRRVANELRSAQAAARQLETATSGLGSLGRGGSALLSGLGIGVGAGAGLGAITAIGAAIADMASDGARMAPLAQAFERLQGGAGNAFVELQKLRTATRGLVSDADLMRQSNQATQLQLTAMGVDMGKLAGAAVRLGAAVGNDATTSIDNLVGALGRGSTEVLDNLGITLKVAEAQEIYADRLGKTTAQLTDQEKKQAFVTIGLERAIEAANRLGEQQLTTAQQAERIATAIGDMGASMFSAGNQSVTLAGQLGEVADVLERIRNARPGDIGNVIATELSRAGARLRAASEQAVNDAPWYLRALAETGTAPARLAGAAAGLAAPYFGTTNFQSLPGNPLAATIPAMSAPGAAAGIGSVVDINAIREAVQRLTAAQREAIKEAKALGASNKEAANAAGTTENVVRAFVAMESGAKMATAAVKAHASALAEMTGADVIANGRLLAQHLQEVQEAGGKINAGKIEQYAKALMAARKAAFEAGEETWDLREALDSLPIASRRVEGINPLFFGSYVNGQSLAAIAGMAATRGVTSGMTGRIASSNPLAGSLVGLAPEVEVAHDAFRRIEEAHRRLATSTRDWRVEVTNIARALGDLGQIAGPSLDPMTRSIGIAITSLSAAEQLVTSIGQAFNKNFDFGKSQTGQIGATAIGAGIAGWQIGSAAGLSPWRAAGAGALTGAGQGAMYGGAGFAVGAIVGATSAYFGAQKAESELRKQKDLQMQQLVAQYGSLDALLEAVGRLGLNQHTFLKQYYGEPKEFAKGVTDLSNALTRESAEATKLGKALESVSRVQGVLSRQQLAAIGRVRAGGPGAEQVVEFAAQQRAQAEGGLASAIGALNQQASLSDAEIEELTRGITDSAERQRVIEAELKRRATETLERFGLGAQAAATGLFVAFTEAVNQGESAIEVIRRLAPSIQSLQQLFERAGLTPGAGFQNLQVLSNIATGPETAPAVQLAQGLAQALAGFANTGLLSPELFGELANGIGQAYHQLELLGQGGLEAARLMQPGLQAIWQMIQDNPALRGQLDGTTLSLLEFAEQAGLIGEAFRPAIDQMIDALNDLIAKLNEFIDRIGQIPGMPQPQLPTVPGAPDPSAPLPGTPGTPSNPNPPPNGGDYPEPSALSFGGATPDSIVPLSGGGAYAAPMQITVVSNIDGYEAARAVTRHQPAVYRQYGAA
jgi:hypothetical protein